MDEEILSQLVACVGAENVHTNGGAPYRVTPPTQEALATVVTIAQQNSWKMGVQGHGSKWHWGNPLSDYRLLVSTTKLDRLLEHAVGDLTVTAEAGISFRELQSQLARSGQCMAIDPPYADAATLGGVVATGASGAWRHRYLGVRDQVLGLQFVRADGKIAKAGGRVVKNVAGYDLMKLLTGSYGTLAILTQITLRLYPLPPDRRAMVILGDGATLSHFRTTLLRSALTPICFDLFSPVLLSRLEMGRGDDWGIVLEFASISASTRSQMELLAQIATSAQLSYVVIPDCELFWRSVQSVFWQGETGNITCKVGVPAAKAIETLQTIGAVHPLQVHGGSGLGVLQMAPQEVTDPVLVLRSWRKVVEASQGFLTVLEAPLTVKTQIDCWGYRKEIAQLMDRLRQQFDPSGLLNPDRFA